MEERAFASRRSKSFSGGKYSRHPKTLVGRGGALGGVKAIFFLEISNCLDPESCLILCGNRKLANKKKKNISRKISDQEGGEGRGGTGGDKSGN